MNVPLIAARRTTSICLSCRRSILRQFSSTTRRAFPEFQSYRLNPQPPSPPRSAGGPDTSITRPMEPPPLPRVHETRPPGAVREAAEAAAAAHTSAPEKEAQKSQAEFVTDGVQSTVPEAGAPAQAAAGTSAAGGEKTTESAAARTPQQPSSTTQSPTSASASASTKPSSPATRPRSKLRAPRKAAMKLTPTAVGHLRSLLDQPDPKLIKVGVRNRGCSGLAYHLEYVDKAGAFDEAVEQDGVKVLIDSKALFSIIGSEMDWVEDKLNQRFVFRNPNIKEQCGCGESFMV